MEVVYRKYYEGRLVSIAAMWKGDRYCWLISVGGRDEYITHKPKSGAQTSRSAQGFDFAVISMMKEILHREREELYLKMLPVFLPMGCVGADIMRYAMLQCTQ